MNEHDARRARGDRRPVVIFGAQMSASLARYCLAHDSPYQVAGFTLDRAYLRSQQYEGLPLWAFETLEERCPPADYRLLIPIGYHGINGVRRARYEDGKRRGYSFVSYISRRASVWPDLQLGENVLIYEHAIVQPFSRIGDNCIIRSGVHISHHCHVASHAFLAPAVAMGGAGRIGEQAFIGVGAVLRDRIRIAERSFIGAGAVVVQATQADAAYLGNPARRIDKSALQASSA